MGFLRDIVADAKFRPFSNRRVIDDDLTEYRKNNSNDTGYETNQSKTKIAGDPVEHHDLPDDGGNNKAIEGLHDGTLPDKGATIKNENTEISRPQLGVDSENNIDNKTSRHPVINRKLENSELNVSNGQPGSVPVLAQDNNVVPSEIELALNEPSVQTKKYRDARVEINDQLTVDDRQKPVEKNGEMVDSRRATLVDNPYAGNSGYSKKLHADVEKTVFNENSIKLYSPGASQGVTSHSLSNIKDDSEQESINLSLTPSSLNATKKSANNNIQSSEFDVSDGPKVTNDKPSLDLKTEAEKHEPVPSHTGTGSAISEKISKMTVGGTLQRKEISTRNSRQDEGVGQERTHHTDVGVPTRPFSKPPFVLKGIHHASEMSNNHVIENELDKNIPRQVYFEVDKVTNQGGTLYAGAVNPLQEDEHKINTKASKLEADKVNKQTGTLRAGTVNLLQEGEHKSNRKAPQWISQEDEVLEKEKSLKIKTPAELNDRSRQAELPGHDSENSSGLSSTVFMAAMPANGLDTIPPLPGAETIGKNVIMDKFIAGQDAAVHAKDVQRIAKTSANSVFKNENVTAQETKLEPKVHNVHNTSSLRQGGGDPADKTSDLPPGELYQVGNRFHVPPSLPSNYLTKTPHSKPTPPRNEAPHLEIGQIDIVVEEAEVEPVPAASPDTTLQDFASRHYLRRL